MPRGRPFEPGNQIGRGRPRGSRNKRNQVARALLDEHGEALVRKAMVEALKGDVPLLRTLLGFLLPRWKEAPVRTGPLPTGTAIDVRASLDRIFQKVGTGDLSLQEGRAFAGMLATRQAVLLQDTVRSPAGGFREAIGGGIRRGHQGRRRRTWPRRLERS